jgi:hypothetical protein
MNRRILISVGAGVGLAVLAYSNTSSAFVTLSPRRVWDVLPVNIDINTLQAESTITDGDNGRSALDNAINDQVAGWDAIGIDLVFLYETQLAAVQGDGFPTIEFNDPINICTGGCLAATLTGFFHATSGDDTIDDADVYVDRQARFTSENEDSAASCNTANEFYIEGVMQHEIGHVIGLGHTNVAGATMGAFANTCDRGQDELAADDLNGANNLY